MKPHATEEGKTAQDNFTNAMKTLFRATKSTPQDKKPKPANKKNGKHQ
jgi:hypothetical protein